MKSNVMGSPLATSTWAEARKWVVVAILAAILGVASVMTGGHGEFQTKAEVVEAIEVRQAPLEKQVDRIDANVQWLVERELDKSEGK